MATTGLFRQEPAMLRGTLFMLRRRCGKPNCRCTTGALHETPALAFPQTGRTKTVTLSADDIEEVRLALERYNTARSELDARADAGLSALRAQLDQRRRTR